MEHDYLALAARIEAFELDEPGVVDTFSRRLARENGWSNAYTERVVQEYKRFLTLAATTKHVVSPSEQVDQAWHLHVLHAARYRQFCRDVLGQKLDHGPSDGGNDERVHFVRAYEQTLASYEKLFGEPAPSDVWPDAQQRFGTDLAVRRVNTVEHWVVRKPRFWLWLKQRRAASPGTAGNAIWLGLLSALVCGCRASLSDHASGPSFLRGFLLLWLATLVFAFVSKQAKGAKTTSAPPVLEPYALAQLAGGPAMAVDSALTSLVARGCIELDSHDGHLVAKREAPRHAAALEHDVYAVIARAGRLDAREVQRQAGTLTRAQAERLVLSGLMTARGSKLPLVIALIAPVVGTFRILSRLGSDKPISILVLLTLAATVLAFWAFRTRPQRTPLGDATIAQAREVHEPLQQRASAADLAENGTLPVMFALFGVGAIVGLTDWTSYLERRSASYSPGGCGNSYSPGHGCSAGSGCSGDGGCSGGGCGGGCGGCGGGGE